MAPTLYAQWTENTYTVTYNANGGSGSMSNTVGHYVALSDNGFTAPSGKAFVEWNTEDDGTGTSYHEGEELELTAGLDLYAIWAKDMEVSWTVKKQGGNLYRGGGDHAVTAEIDDALWDASGNKNDLVLTASTGIVLRNVVKSINDDGTAQVTAKFDITTDVPEDATKISFTLSVPAAGEYAPKNATNEESLTICGVSVSPSLTWDTDLSGGVDAETGDADFVHTVTQNKNSLGAITYISSNTSVVTVHATTGNVHVVGAGDATITATLAESGCYDGATSSYAIHVANSCADALGTLTTDDLGCNGIRLTVTGHDAEGATYQWYKDGAAVTDSTRVSYVAKTAGVYYVVVTNTCARASNTVRLQSREAATATALVDSFYVKNGRKYSSSGSRIK